MTTLFSGGDVFDGTGSGLQRVDVLIDGGTVIDVGPGLSGDTVIDPRLIKLPDDLPEGSYDLRVGWYRLDDLTRLPVMNDQGQTLSESSIPLFALEVTR